MKAAVAFATALNDGVLLASAALSAFNVEPEGSLGGLELGREQITDQTSPPAGRQRRAATHAPAAAPAISRPRSAKTMVVYPDLEDQQRQIAGVDRQAENRAFNTAMGIQSGVDVVTRTYMYGAMGSQGGPGPMVAGIVDGLILGTIASANRAEYMYRNRQQRYYYGTNSDQEQAAPYGTVVVGTVGLSVVAVLMYLLWATSSDNSIELRSTQYMDAKSNPDADDYNKYKDLMTRR